MDNKRPKGRKIIKLQRRRRKDRYKVNCRKEIETLRKVARNCRNSKMEAKRKVSTPGLRIGTDQLNCFISLPPG
jgi:hypothetical protein